MLSSCMFAHHSVILFGGYETWLIESENSYSESGEGKLVKNKGRWALVVQKNF